MNYNKNLVEQVRQQYPAGTRIRLESLCNDEPGMPTGLCGTVVGVDDQPALLMKWDNGRGLSLLYGKDSFSILEQTPEEVINIELYEKLKQEQKQYEDSLQSMPFRDVLDKSWEYVMRQDILVLLETCDLKYDRAASLLELPNTMDVLAQAAKEQDTRYMDH